MTKSTFHGTMATMGMPKILGKIEKFYFDPKRK